MAAMKYRPLIGINTDYRASAKGRTPHSFIHSGYFECLLAANAMPVIIPPLTRESRPRADPGSAGRRDADRR